MSGNAATLADVGTDEPARAGRCCGRLVVERDRSRGGELRRRRFTLLDDVLPELAFDNLVVDATKTLSHATAVVLKLAQRLIILFLLERKAFVDAFVVVDPGAERRRAIGVGCMLLLEFFDRLQVPRSTGSVVLSNFASAFALLVMITPPQRV